MSIIKGIPNSLAGLGAIALVAGGYTVYAILSKSKTDTTAAAKSLTVSIYPKTVKNAANSFITLSGSFDQPVPSAFYYIYEEMNDSTDPKGVAKHGHPVLTASLGQNIKEFNVKIPTHTLRYGNYFLLVSDTAVDTSTPVPLEGSNAGESPSQAQTDNY